MPFPPCGASGTEGCARLYVMRIVCVRVCVCIGTAGKVMESGALRAEAVGWDGAENRPACLPHLASPHLTLPSHMI